MLPTEGGGPGLVGRLGAELDVDRWPTRRDSLAALNVLAVAREHLGSLDGVTRIVRLGVAVATSGDVRDQPKVADGASMLLQECSARRGTLVASCTASQVFRSACRWNWK